MTFLKIGEAGLCDLHPPVLRYVYNNAQIKPISIQVTLTHHITPTVRQLQPLRLPPDQPEELLCGAGGTEPLRQGEGHHPLHPLRPQRAAARGLPEEYVVS